MMHLKVVRSPYARARILKVRGGITGFEFMANMAAVGEGAEGGPVSVPFPALASQYVSYVGQPVAAVLGKDPYNTEDMIDEVEVEYEPLKALVDPEEASHFEPIHPGTKSNIIERVRLGHEFRSGAPVVLEDELVNGRISPNPMEPRGLVAHYDGSKLTVWASTQSVHAWKEGITEVMRLPREAVRIIQVDVGGAFGSKGAIYPEYAVACYASMKTRRPVKWIETRSEHLVATEQGRGARAKMTVYADRRGRIEGLKADILVDNGAYPVNTWAPRAIGFQVTGPYAIRKAFVTGSLVYTNKVPLGPYRGAGRPEASFFIERMMDLLADGLNLDPVEVRLRNASPKPFVSPLGLKIDPFEPFLRSAVDELGYAKRGKGKGVGFSCFVLVPAVQPGESARILVRGGRVKVWMGGSQSGQAHEVIAQRIVSEELGIPQSSIELEAGDTDQLDQGIGTWGSRSAIVGGAALIEASRKIREQMKDKLGRYSPEELLKDEFDITVFHREGDQMNSFGANLVTITLDETGEARVDECLAYYDVGRVLNPSMVEGQIAGGSLQGIGQVLYEEAKYDEDGQPLIGSIADAGVPTSTTMPRFTIKLASYASAHPDSIRGVGEASTIGVPPAVIRALERALGRRLRRTPVHPEEIARQSLENHSEQRERVKA